MCFGNRVCVPAGKEKAPDLMPRELVLLGEGEEKAMWKPLYFPSRLSVGHLKQARQGWVPPEGVQTQPDLLPGGDPDARAVATWPLRAPAGKPSSTIIPPSSLHPARVSPAPHSQGTLLIPGTAAQGSIPEPREVGILCTRL